MISFPWDNTSATVLDRNSTSDILAESYFNALAGYNSGIYAPVGTQGAVAPGTGMNVVVQPVTGVIKGRVFKEEAVRTLTVQASKSLDRIDTVVIRRNKTGRAVDLYVVKGTAASSPVRPALTRSGDIYECGIADVFIPKLATGIMAYHITDTRSETARCQIVPVVGSVDTTSFYDQYQASLDEFLALVQSALDETTAGYLQGQINTTKILTAKAWMPGTSYPSQTYVTHNDKLWKVNTMQAPANAGEEPGVAVVWLKITDGLGGEVRSLRGAVDALAIRPATKGAKTTVATSLTVGQVFTAPSDGVYEIKATFSATTGYVIMSQSNGQSYQINSAPTSAYGQVVHIPVNGSYQQGLEEKPAQTVTITALGSVETAGVSFFRQN